MSLSKRSNLLSENWDLASVVVPAFALILGAFLRLIPALSADFPPNDGGLFYAMVQDLRAARYALPAYASYNSLSMPFAYPPLALYLAAFLTDLTGWPLLEVFRFLPAIVSILLIPAFYLFSRTMLPKLPAGFATLAFALLPQGFTKYVMGGGLTRAPGALFALLMLHQAYLLYSRRQARFAWMTALCASLTVLSHPEAAWFAVYSGALLFLFYGRHRHGIFSTLLLAIGVVALTAPWWATVLLRYGPAPLLAATQAGGESWYSWLVRLAFYFTADNAYLIAPLTVVGLLGLFASLARREFFLPLWLVAIFCLSPRASATLATVPLAMLVGIGLERIVLPGIRQLGKAGSTPVPNELPQAPPDRAAPARPPAGGLAGAVVGALFFLTLLSAWLRLSFWSPLPILPPGDHEALRWVAAHTAEDSRFVVITPDNPYWNPTEEWFPALTGRVSLTTVQGAEWLPGQQYAQQVEWSAGPLRCAAEGPDCLDDWARQAQVAFTHIYISTVSAEPARAQPLCPSLENSLRASSDYRLIYDAHGVAVFARTTLNQGP